jgi:hypothetical protein
MFRLALKPSSDCVRTVTNTSSAAAVFKCMKMHPVEMSDLLQRFMLSSVKIVTEEHMLLSRLEVAVCAE